MPAPSEVPDPADTRSRSAQVHQEATELVHGSDEPEDPDRREALAEQQRQSAAERHAHPEDHDRDAPPT